MFSKICPPGVSSVCWVVGEDCEGDASVLASALSELSLASKLERTGVDPEILQELTAP